jgi:RES domain
MSRYPPPDHPTSAPNPLVLPSGTQLYRIHPSAFSAASFNPNAAHRYFFGGRFDSTQDDPYDYLYAADTPESAAAETLLRDMPIDDHGAVVVAGAQIEGRRISRIELRVDIELVDLCGLVALRACSQSDWLTSTEPRDYPQTRHWGHWIRTQAPNAAGFVWLSKRDPTKQSYVLFGDRCPPGAIEVGPVFAPGGVDPNFDTDDGRAYLNHLLSVFNAHVEAVS